MDILSALRASITSNVREMVVLLDELGSWAEEQRCHLLAGNEWTAPERVLSSVPKAQAILSRISQSADFAPRPSSGTATSSLPTKGSLST